MQDIEFICINDGSTDNCLDIINEYVASDSRFKLLNKQNSGYGDSMNKGLAMAKGKYIGIVESDDWAESDMFEQLSSLAEANNAQAVKSNFYFYVSYGGGSNKKFSIVDPNEVGVVVSPRVTPHIFKGMSTIWSGLYSRQFLIDNDINFVPSPGASYQDTAFNFKVWAAATRVIYTDKAYLHYRIDNESSSVKSRSKVFCVCDEFASIKKYLLDHRLMSQLKSVYTQRKLDIYLWNASRLDGTNLRDFVARMSKELNDDRKQGLIDTALCSSTELSALKSISNSPSTYLAKRSIKAFCSKPYNLCTRLTNKANPSRAKRLHIVNTLQGAYELNQDTLLSYESRIPSKKTDATPGISIIIPVYNAARYLCETLDSLLVQTFSDIEIICVNDGSTDTSLDILNKYQKQDKRVRIITQPNSGVATARNAGLKNAAGKYIMWCDSDDTYDPNMCLKMYCAMERRHTDLAICSQNIIYDEVGKSLVKDTSAYLQHKYHDEQLITCPLITDTDVSLWNKIFRRDIIERYDIHFPDGLLFEDAYFCNTYMLKSKTIYFMEDKLYNYIRRPQSIMSTSFKKSKSSGDYLRITAATYEFLKEHNIYDQYADFFWLRMIQDYSYAYDNLDSTDRKQATAFVESFINDHKEDFNRAGDDLRQALLKLLKHGPSHKLSHKVKYVIQKIWVATSAKHRQELKMFDLTNRISAQAEYLSMLAGLDRSDR